MKEPIFSIIIPAYCSQETIEACIESVLKTNRVSLEILVIDDGSTDATAEKVSAYVTKDTKVRYIKKVNGGQSSARNRGIREARGNYIVFLDSDDTIEAGALDSIYKMLSEKEADIVMADAIFYEGKDQYRVSMRESKEGTKLYTSKEFLMEQLTQRVLWTPVWFNVYKKDFLIRENLFFQEGIYLEDDEWIIRTFLKADIILYSGILLYHYFIRENSVMRQKDCSKHVMDGMEIYRSMQETYSKMEDKQLAEILNGWVAERFLVLYATWPKEFWKLRIELDKKWILKHAIKRTVRWKAYLYSISPQLYCMISLLKHAL